MKAKNITIERSPAFGIGPRDPRHSPQFSHLDTPRQRLDTPLVLHFYGVDRPLPPSADQQKPSLCAGSSREPCPLWEDTDGSLLHFFPFLKSTVHEFFKVKLI